MAHLVLVDNPAASTRVAISRWSTDLVRAMPASRMLTFSGLGAYRADCSSRLTRGAKHALAPLLREQMAQGRVTGEHYRGLWTDVGTPERLAELDARLQPGGTDVIYIPKHFRRAGPPPPACARPRP